MQKKSYIKVSKPLVSSYVPKTSFRPSSYESYTSCILGKGLGWRPSQLPKGIKSFLTTVNPGLIG